MSLKFSYHCTDCNKERPLKNGTCSYCGSVDVELIDLEFAGFRTPKREDFR